MIGGVDAVVELPDGVKTMQIKPFNNTKNENGKVTVYGTANVKPYKTDYLVFHNNNLGTLVFSNHNTLIIDGRYVFDEDSQYNK